MSFRSQPRSVSTLAVGSFAAVAILPVFLIFVRHGSLGALAILDARQGVLLLRSLGVAGGAMIIALALGIPIAILLVRGQAQSKLLLGVAAIAPVFIPPYVLTGAWIGVLDSDCWLNDMLTTLAGHDVAISIYCPAGAAWCLGVAFYPIVSGVLGIGLTCADRDLEDAARLTANHWGVFRCAIFPQVRRHIAAAALLVLLFSFVRYDIPSLLGVNTYPVEIFSQFSAFYDVDAALKTAAPLTIVALLIAMIPWFIVRSQQYPFESSGARMCVGKRKRRVTSAIHSAMLVVFLIAVVYGPLGHMAAQLRSTDVLSKTLQTAGADVLSTGLWAASAATIALVVAVPTGAYLSGNRGRVSAVVGLLCWLPVAVPGTVIGLGVLMLWGPLGTGWGGVGVSLIHAYVAAFVPFAVLVCTAARGADQATLDQMAAIDGATWFRRFIHVDVALHWPAFLTAWMLVFALSTAELDATVLLVPPGRSTLGVTIDNLLHYGANPVATMLCLLAAVMGICPLVISVVLWYSFSRKQ
jgi:iron(III) transport system permease protein